MLLRNRSYFSPIVTQSYKIYNLRFFGVKARDIACF
jgi:hypothetical protein